MLKLKQEWGRLAPLPTSRTQFTIRTDGNAATRSFSASFYLSKADLLKWVADSSGLQDAETETAGTSAKKYTIKPGGGASDANAVINFDKGYVQTYVCWS